MRSGEHDEVAPRSRTYVANWAGRKSDLAHCAIGAFARDEDISKLTRDM